MEISHLGTLSIKESLKTPEKRKHKRRRAPEKKKNVFPFHPKQIELRGFFKNQSPPPYPPASTPPDESITLTNLPLQTPIYSGRGGRKGYVAALLKKGVGSKKNYRSMFLDE